MSNRPANLVIIMSDQHSRERIGCYGDEFAHTPYIDQLAAEGTLFANSYCNSPICMPSRASMATGEYVHKFGCWDNAHPYAGEIKSWGHRLEQEGVHVTTIGKLHFKGDIPQTGFLDQRMPLHAPGGIGNPYASIRDTRASRPLVAEWIKKSGIGEHEYNDYDRRVAETTNSFLEEKAREKNTKPWVLFVGFVRPHFPLLCPSKYMFDPRDVPFPKAYWKGVRPEHPVLAELRRYFCLEEDFNEATVRRIVAAYYGLCSFLDDQIGKILKTIKNSGLKEFTRVIYTSDHGDHVGDHGLWNKSTMYEGSVGVPLILSGQDISKGKRIFTNVSLIDLYPTILDCVGIKLNEIDIKKPGLSLFNYLTENNNEDRAVFAEYHATGALTDTFMLRDRRYKLIYHVGYESQLFDLEKDPDELNDLVANQEIAEIKEGLEKKLRLICDPEIVSKQCEIDRQKILERFGGKEKILKDNKNVYAYSPVQNEM